MVKYYSFFRLYLNLIIDSTKFSYDFFKPLQIKSSAIINSGDYDNFNTPQLILFFLCMNRYKYILIMSKSIKLNDKLS